MRNFEIQGSFYATRLFKDIPGDVPQKLLASSLLLDIGKNQRLFEKGDAAGSIYLVKTGRIEISLISEGGKKVVFNQIGPGQCFGEIGLVDQKPRTASAVALEESRVQLISRLHFFEAVQQCPQLAINLLEIFSERVRWMSDSVEEYAVHPLELRLARRLLVLHRNFASETGDVEISQNDLADFAGATRESTNKILIDWQEKGIIELGRRRISIVKPAQLEVISGGEHNGAR